MYTSDMAFTEESEKVSIVIKRCMISLFTQHIGIPTQKFQLQLIITFGSNEF